MKLSPTRVLWREPWSLLANAWVLLPIGLSLSFCLIGLPVAGRALKALSQHALKNARALSEQTARSGFERSFAGSIGFVGWLLACIVMLSAGGLAVHIADGANELVRLLVQLIGGSLGIVAIGAALGPLLAAPILASDGVRGPFGPFARSFELAARRGPRATARLGARVGLAFAVPHLALGIAVYLLSTSVDPMDSVGLAGPLAAWVGMPRALAILAIAYVKTPESIEENRNASGTSRLYSLAWMIAPAMLVVFATFAFAALSPTPMRGGDSEGPVVRGMGPIGLSATPRSGSLPGTSVSIRTTDDGIVVEAEDGGGAGAIEAGFDTSQCMLQVGQRSVHGAPVDEFQVVVWAADHYAYTVIDADGVRLDDSITQRTFGRLRGFGSGTLGLGMLLLLFLSFTVGTELGAAQTMGAPALLEGRDRRRDSLAALEGTLRVAEGSRVVYSPPRGIARLLGRGSGRLRVEGEAWVEADAGAIRFRLPDGAAEVLGTVGSDGWDGKHVVLLSSFESSGIAGLRTAAAPWPDDGRLTLGTRSDARDVLVDRAVKRASRVALPMLVSFGLACATVLLHL